MRALLTDQHRNKTAASAPPAVRSVLAAPGRPLDAETRAFFEPRFGHNFSNVRVHTDATAAESAAAVGAHAFTVGQHIVMGRADDGARPALLAHELGHTLQQPRYEGDAPLYVEDSHEHAVDAAAQRVLDPAAPPGAVSLPPASSAHVACFRGPMPRPVRPPPRAPVQTVPGTSRGPTDAPAQAPLMAPDPYDTSFQAMLDRASIRSYAERQRIAAERPVATLDRGGQPPDFITERGTRTYSWMGGPGGGGSVQARIRRFHVLDALEHDVSRISDPAQLEGVIRTYLPDQSELILLAGTGRSPTTLSPFVLRLSLDEPLFPTNFDPQGQTRLQVLQAAVERRAQTVPALAQSQLTPRGRRQGPCRLEPTEPMGDDPLSGIYCHAVTGSPYSYKITILSPTTGNATQRWAEIDALRGNTWYECKCGYEALLSGAARGQGVANAVLNRLDHQVLNHVEIARTCGLQYRYIVSNESVAERLRARWFGNVEIEVREFDPCD